MTFAKKSLIAMLFLLCAGSLRASAGNLVYSRPTEKIVAPQGPHLFEDPYTLALPLLLTVYYFVVWMKVGRDPELGPVATAYKPPAGMSPAEVRYVVTSGSDRKTIAAALAHMATEKVIRIIPADDAYLVTRLVEAAPAEIPDEEKRVFEVLYPKDAANPQGPTRRVDPKDAPLMTQFSSQITDSLNKRLIDRYYQRNLGWSTAAFLFSWAYAEFLAMTYPAHEIGFLVMWFLLFSLGIGVVIASNIVPLFKDLLRGELNPKNAFQSFFFIPIFVGAPLFVDYIIAGKTSWAFAEMMVLILVLNIVWGVLLKAPTAAGIEAKRQIEGFKQYLESVERDRLDKLNQPDKAPVVLEEFLAYAIALDLKEGWGDRLENALFGVATSR